jgi:hypothetical protein
LALPDTEDELIRYYTFSESDLSVIRQRRGDANRLGIAVQLCLLRFPGQGLLPDAAVPVTLLQWIGRQLSLDLACWPQYAEREETRREHLLELRAYLGMEPFGLAHYQQGVHTVTELALANDLPDAIITESGLKITPLDAAVPDTAQALINQAAMILPHVKITELLLEVDAWTCFTRHFKHLKSGDLATSIKQGTVTASLMLRKLGSYPRQNGLTVALRELGRIERTLFICG